MNPYAQTRRLKHNLAGLSLPQRDRLRSLRDESRGKVLMHAMYRIRFPAGALHAALMLTVRQAIKEHRFVIAKGVLHICARIRLKSI